MNNLNLNVLSPASVLEPCTLHVCVYLRFALPQNIKPLLQLLYINLSQKFGQIDITYFRIYSALELRTFIFLIDVQ